jgi:MFS superfamily sulfate permease-like transporter
VVLLLFLNSLLSDLPQSALAAVVIAAALSLVNVRALREYARARWSSVLLSLVATLGVITLGVLDGIVVAILLAVLMFFRRNWWPHGEVVGRVEGMDGWHSLTAFPDAQEPPGVLVYRWEAPLFFANARTFREQIRHLVRERNPLWVVIQCEAITDIDVTAAETLAQLDVELNASGVHIALAEMRTRLQDLTQRYGLFETIHHGRFFPSVEAALEEIGKERT